MQVVRGKAAGAQEPKSALLSSVTCAGVLEKNTGSHFFASAQVVLDIQIVSEPES